MKNKNLKMNLQMFAENGENGENVNGEAKGGTQASNNIDYNKIKNLLDGTLAAKEKTVLNSYFKQQGLSQEEVEKAIATFKTEKEKNTPDVNKLLEDLEKAKKKTNDALIEKEAFLMASKLLVDINTVPYLLKLADLKDIIKEDGSVEKTELEKALKKVVDDVPAFKVKTAFNGFTQVGKEQEKNAQTPSDELLKKAFGVK